MIDYFFKWNSQAEAKADALMLADHLSAPSSLGVRGWTRDHVLPDVTAWRPSQDITSSGIVIHSYQAGWFAIVSLRNQIPLLLNSSQLAFALNRDGPPYIIKNNIGVIISDIAVAPVFAGSHYPIGGYSS